MFSPFNTKLAGVSFSNCQANIMKWGHPDIGYFSLEREPDNPHDPNAVGVWFLITDWGTCNVLSQRDWLRLWTPGKS